MCLEISFKKSLLEKEHIFLGKMLAGWFWMFDLCVVQYFQILYFNKYLDNPIYSRDSSNCDSLKRNKLL